MSMQVGAIKDFVEGIYDGPHATPKESDHGPVFLGIKNVTPEGRLDLTEIKHVSPEDYPRWTKRVTPQKDDIVFSYEATLHRYALIPDGFFGCLGRRMALIRPDKTKVHPQFLHYFFLSNAWRREVEASIISGATVDRIPLTKVPRFLVSVPGLRQQEIIVGILSCYDDLIENNWRRIALLEDAARQLYKEWFVRLRFPGHEHVKIINGVPEGWHKRTLTQLSCDVSYGFTASADSAPVGPKFLRITDIVNDVLDWSSVPFCSIPETKLEKFSLKEGDVVVARTGATTGYAKRIGKLPAPSVFASYLVRFRFSEAWDNLLAGIFLESSEYKAFVRSHLGGAAQPNANAKILGRATVIVPPITLQRQFREIVLATFSQVDNLIAQNIQLRKARYLLLPKLMSGEISA